MESFVKKSLLTLLSFFLIGILHLSGNGQNDERKICNAIMIMDFPGTEGGDYLEEPEKDPKKITDTEVSKEDAKENIEEEWEEEEINVIALDIGNAFIQTSAPIIVNASAFYTYLDYVTAKESATKAKADFDLLYPSTSPTIAPDIKKLNYPNDKYVEVAFSYQWGKDGWFLCSDPDSKMFVLIPKPYGKSVTEHEKLNLIKKAGFDPDFITATKEDISNLEDTYTLMNRLYDLTEKQWGDPLAKNEEEGLLSIKKMFSQDPNNWWSIYLDGHGNLPRTEENDKNFAAISSKARIAGFSFSNFKKLVTFLNGPSASVRGINTLFFWYMSCFVGVYNQALMQQTLNEIKARFFAVAQGTGDFSVYLTYTPKQYISPNPPYEASFTFPVDFKDFFDGIAGFFSEPKEFTKIASKYARDPLVALVKTVSGSINLYEKNQPFIYIPSVGVFGALNVDQEVTIITNVLAKAHAFENKPFEAQDKKCIQIYPSRITSPINLSESTSLVSLKLPIWKEELIEGKKRLVIPASFKIIHYLDTVNVSGSLNRFYYSLFSTKSPYMQLWLINTLTGENKRKEKETYSKVMIWGKLPGTLFILKTDKNGDMFQAKIPANFLYAPEEANYFWETCNTLAFEKTTNAQAQEITKELLDPTEQKQVKNFKDMFELLSKKTKSKTDVKKPGSLKDILEKKLKEIKK